MDSEMKTFNVTAELTYLLDFEVDAENASTAKTKLFDRLTGDYQLPDGLYMVSALHRYSEKTQGGKPDPDRNPEFGYGEHWKTCPIGFDNGLKITEAVEKEPGS